MIEAAFASSRTVKLDPSAGTAKILGATWNVATAEGWVDSSKLTADGAGLTARQSREGFQVQRLPRGA